MMVEELEQPADPAYRSFVSIIDRILKLFENTSEWQDLISSLGKLNKALSAHGPKFHVIPRCVLIGKRLAQCMHPNLPSGVHLKAIETYDTIMKVIGSSGLAQQLFICSSGIFPLLALAATSVKPALLQLYEAHFISLGHALKPGLPGFLAGTLPALEEGSESFDRVDSLLEKISDSVGASFFYLCTWEAIYNNPSVRRPALEYVLRHFDKSQPLDEQMFLVGNNVDTMVRAICASLEDQSILVERASLEFVVVAMPLSRSSVSPEAITTIASLALSTILKRDMSLNRRLYAWLLGTDSTTLIISEHGQLEQRNFFESHSKEMLIQAIKLNMKKSPSDVKQYRILISLLEKPEIGPEIIDSILVDIFRSIRYSTLTYEKNEERLQDFLRIVSSLFNSLEPHYVWSFVADKFHEICDSRKSGENPVEIPETESVRAIGSEVVCIPEICILSETLLQRLPLEKETLESHLPRCCAEILKILTEYSAVLSCDDFSASLKLCEKIFEKIESHWERVTPIELDEETGSGFATACASPTEVQKYDEKIPKLGEFRKLITLTYASFMEAKVVAENVDMSFLEVKYKRDETEELLKSVIGGNKVCEATNQNEELRLVREPAVMESSSAKTYEELCGLLLKLARYSLLSKQFDGDKTWKRQESALNLEQLPQWLYGLIFLCVSPGLVQLSSIELLLDLFYLTQSSQETLQVRKKDNFVSVALLPLLKFDEFEFLVKQTRIYQVLAEILWDEMKKTKRTELVAKLIYKLHGLTPITSSQYMEEAILVDFQKCGLEGSDKIFRIFSELWKNGRSEAGTKPVRSFERCLFRVFDFLSHPSSRLQTASRKWLRENIHKRDTSRIFKPLLNILLGKSVLRRDPRYVAPPPPRKVSEEHHEEPKIRAISSVNGDVVYYVANGDEMVSPRHSRILTTTSMDSDSYVTKESDVKNVNFPWLHQQIVSGKLLRPVSMFVNPLGGVEGVELGQEAHGRSSSVPYIPGGTGEKLRRHSLSDPTTLPAAPVRFVLEQEAHDIALEIVDEIIDKAVRKAMFRPMIDPKDSLMKTDVEVKPELKEAVGKFDDIRKSYGFIYEFVPDFDRIQHVLDVLHEVIKIDPKLVLWKLATTGINNQESRLVLDLLSQQRMSLLQKRSNLTIETESVALFRSFMYLDAVLYSLLGFTRSFVPENDLNWTPNLELQLKSIELLNAFTKYLVELLLSGGVSFAAYVEDLYRRCKVHGIVLLTLLHQYEERNTRRSKHLIAVCLDLVLQLIILDSTLDGIVQRKVESRTQKNDDQYQADLAIHMQPVFMSFLQKALEDTSFIEMIEVFTTFFIKCLPHLGIGLPAISMFIFREFTKFLDESMERGDDCEDYELSLFEGLTVVVHYSLIGGISSIPPSYGGAGNYKQSSDSPAGSKTQILTNLLHAFSPGLAKEEISHSHDPVLMSKKLLLSNLSRLVHCTLLAWQSAKNRESHRAVVLRTMIREMLGPISCNHLFNFLSALALVWHDQKSRMVSQRVTSFEASEGQEELVDLISHLKVLPPDTLITNIRNVFKNPPAVQGISSKFSLEVSLLQFLMTYLPTLSTVQLMESREPLFALLQDGATLAPNALVWCLSILDLWVSKVPSFDKKSPKEVQDVFNRLVEACLNVAGSCLEQTTWLRRNLTVKRDAQLPALAPTDVQTFSTESASRDEIANTKGVDIPSQDSGSPKASRSPSNSVLTHSGSQAPPPPSGSTSSYVSDGTSAVLALQALSEIFPSLLDTVYSGEERDKAQSILASVMTVVVPYLKGHSSTTMGGYRCASQLLAGVSNYQFTRRAWRKEAFELLFEPNFFQMDSEGIVAWTKIIENLLVYEKAAFKDLLARVPVGQGSLFTSREADAENRAMLLKRLSFAVLCGDKDDFQHHMPDIQERLADCLRLGQVFPSVQAAVFLCFRVLLIRISDACLTLLWPTIITELVQCLSLLELELNRDTPEFRDHESAYLNRLALLESTWVVGNGNLQTRSHPGWLQVFLQASKLLDLALVVSSEELPQFQLYRWAFIGPVSEGKPNGQSSPEYFPHCLRIARAMRHKVDETEVFDMPGLEPGTTLITSRTISSLTELYPFYNLVSQPEFNKLTCNARRTDQKIVAKALLLDFLEAIE